MRLHVGMPVEMSDKWRGTIAEVAGGLVACVGTGEKANACWSGNYRILSATAASISVDGGKMIVAEWKKTTSKKKQRRDAVVADLLAQALLSREWQAAPPD